MANTRKFRAEPVDEFNLRDSYSSSMFDVFRSTEKN